MINKVVPIDKLEEEVERLAKVVTLMPADGIVRGKVGQQLYMDILGMRACFSYGYIDHALGTNLRYEPDEFNFFKERRDKGVKAAIHRKNERFAGLV